MSGTSISQLIARMGGTCPRRWRGERGESSKKEGLGLQGDEEGDQERNKGKGREGG